MKSLPDNKHLFCLNDAFTDAFLEDCKVEQTIKGF
ncbi:MAG: hypothetical protein JWR05_2277 [Mucilaginibacter sp.]|nr:hypothetical protein [Mucilaginibacter sp.]